MLECLEIKERCSIYLSCRYISSHFFDFLYAFRIHRTDGGDRFHEVYPILISSVQYNIRHFIVQNDLKTKLTQLVYVLYEVLLNGATYIKTFRIWGKSRSEILNNSFLKLVCLLGEKVKLLPLIFTFIFIILHLDSYILIKLS